jgi:hypothetical protein
MTRGVPLRAIPYFRDTLVGLNDGGAVYEMDGE